jgi:uncharacterized protein (TIGR02996 family)
MPDYAPFIRTILAYRDALGPRLVLSDYLEEHGECVHAEFIRVACALAALRCRCANALCRPCRKCRPLYERAVALIGTNSMRRVLADPKWMDRGELITEPPGLGIGPVLNEWLGMSLRDKHVFLAQMQDGVGRLTGSVRHGSR